MRRKIEEKKERYKERKRKEKTRLSEILERLERYRFQLSVKEKQGKPIKTLKRRVNSKSEAVSRQKQRMKKMRKKHQERMKRLRDGLKNRRQKDESRVEKMKLRVKTQENSRDYNLTTSLKSYIDPRIYKKWGKRVGYDWKNYYSRTLQKSFSWIDSENILK